MLSADFERMTPWQRLSLLSVCMLAFSVSLGAAVVGLAKLVVLVACIGQLWLDGWQGIRERLRTPSAVTRVVVLAVVWFALSASWTEAASGDAWPAFWRHARLLWLLPVLYLLRTPQAAYRVLACLLAGQGLVLLLSWLLWLGVPVPWTTTRYAPEMGVVFTGHLEQPIMTTLLAVLLWDLRSRWVSAWPGPRGQLVLAVGLALALGNVFLIMTGRMGYLAMLLFIALALWRLAPRQWRWAMVLLPMLSAWLLFELSPRVHDRLLEVQADVQAYQRGEIASSQGLRLEMWRVSLLAAKQAPWVGHGVGSYAQVYRDLHGRDPGGASHPHQQYLFWLVEFGFVGLGLLLAFFAALLWQARRLPPPSANALRSTVWIGALVSLANGPFYGVGLGECLLLMMAALMATQERRSA